MVLSDRTIQEELRARRIVIDPLGEDCIQPASIDLRLDQTILKFRPERYSLIDIRKELTNLTESIEITVPEAPYVLQPQEFILASTLEYVELPDDIVARLEGKSSLGRVGLLIHSTAGYVDPGWKGNLTLEISNVAGVPITLYYGMKISQISFLRLSSPADHPYGSETLDSKYQGQIGPTPTRSYLEFVTRQPRRYPDQPTKLRGWLETSPYAGSVSKLANVLQVQLKTVEDWVYGRRNPSPANRARLFEITKLRQYAGPTPPKQAELFSTEEQPLL